MQATITKLTPQQSEKLAKIESARMSLIANVAHVTDLHAKAYIGYAIRGLGNAADYLLSNMPLATKMALELVMSDLRRARSLHVVAEVLR